MMEGDVVLFSHSPPYAAGHFCYERGIAGKVMGFQLGTILVDAGLGYVIYAQPGDLVLAPEGARPGLDRDGRPPCPTAIPPNDGGI
jgi:hypothetical protein